ncbi:MAG: iron ABC transporter permease [Actinobacteria bacterium]|nr:iron ABC transporter permease [Actinomycetota bacterium]
MTFSIKTHTATAEAITQRRYPICGWRLAPLMLLPFICVFAALFIGRYYISPADTLNALAGVVGLNRYEAASEVATLVVNVRLPRALGAAFVGMALAASGTAFQSIFKNPLTDSGLLGVSNGAGFGAAFAIVFLGGGMFVYSGAFIFGVIAVVVTYWIARIYRGTPSIMLILGGVIVSSVFSSLLSLMKYVADTDTQLPSIVYWLMGSVSSVGYESFWALIPIVLGCTILLTMSWRIDALSMGDKEARSLGVNVRAEKAVIIGAATLATAGAVCLSGAIGWVGLVIPHIGRMLTGNDNTRLLPVSMAIGSSFLVIVDTVSRTVWPSEVPLGIITALIGAPFFVHLLKKTKGGGW